MKVTVFNLKNEKVSELELSDEVFGAVEPGGRRRRAGRARLASNPRSAARCLTSGCSRRRLGAVASCGAATAAAEPRSLARLRSANPC